MRLLEIKKKTVAPAILGGITIDTYRRTIGAHSQELSKLELDKNEVIQKIQTELWSDKVVNSEFKTKLEASSSRLTEVEENIQTLKNNLDVVNSKLSNNNLDIGETKEFLVTNQTYLNSELNKLEATKNSSVKGLQDIINNSDISSYISDFLDNFRKFVDLLNLEQLVALFNIIGYVTILFTLFSITTLLIGDYLIDNFKLEIRFPKLAKLIRIKQILNKHSLFFNIIMFYVIVITFIIMNIYMLLLKYFILKSK